ncbi:MAG TPA: anthranilate phosphoribosyltransferase, partial [Candidatus Omnitrophota bacterium]|nr:anthranilate phosphoribosyltransferase [Candidatus Omnitrophota bacterium]
MTKIISELTEPAIRRGIKTVGIGKKGSKPLEPDLISEILHDLKERKVSAIAQGAFFAALILKGMTEQEMELEKAFTPGILKDPKRLVEAIAFDAPEFAKNICVEFLEGKTIDRETAYGLGKFLLSTDPGDGARGIAASALRVRYETPEEYEGLLLSLQESIEEPFRGNVPPGNPIIQLAEPFDGVDHSYMITPLLANYFQSQGYRVVQLVGRNSGP